MPPGPAPPHAQGQKDHERDQGDSKKPLPKIFIKKEDHIHGNSTNKYEEWVVATISKERSVYTFNKVFESKSFLRLSSWYSTQQKLFNQPTLKNGSKNIYDHIIICFWSHLVRT